MTREPTGGRGRLPVDGRRVLFAAGLVFGAMLIAGPVLASQYVTLRNTQYTPKTMTIQQFDTVVWTHADSRDLQHSVTAAPGQSEDFDSSPNCPPTCMRRGDHFSWTFRHAGTFTYFCRVHCPDNSCGADGMRGTIVVRAFTPVTPQPTPRPIPTPVPRASNSVSVTTPVPTPSPEVTSNASPVPVESAVAAPAPKTTRPSGNGVALGLAIAGAAIAGLGGSLLFLRFRRPA